MWILLILFCLPAYGGGILFRDPDARILRTTVKRLTKQAQRRIKSMESLQEHRIPDPIPEESHVAEELESVATQDQQGTQSASVPLPTPVSYASTMSPAHLVCAIGLLAVCCKGYDRLQTLEPKPPRPSIGGPVRPPAQTRIVPLEIAHH